MRNRRSIAVSALALSIGLAGCSSQNDEDPKPLPTVTEEAGQVTEPRSSPNHRTERAPTGPTQAQKKKALTVAKIMTTWTPGKDKTATDAELRAREHMTEEAAAAVIAPERPAAGKVWTDAANAEATSRPSAEVVDGTDAQGVVVHVTWEWQKDGETVAIDDPEAQRGRLYTFVLDKNNDVKAYTYEAGGSGVADDTP